MMIVRERMDSQSMGINKDRRDRKVGMKSTRTIIMAKIIINNSRINLNSKVPDKIKNFMRSRSKDTQRDELME